MKMTAADILSRHFGVEVEMTNISRPQAAQLCMETLQARHPDRHYHLGHEHAYDTTYVREYMNGRRTRKWAFMYDSSVRQMGPGMAEFVTPLLGWEDMEDLQELIRAFRHAGAKSGPQYDCGVHVHIDAADLGAAQIRNLANLCASHEELLMTATNLDPARRHWCAPVEPRFLQAVNTQRIETLDEMKMAWYNAHGQRWDGSSEHYNSSRYHLLNLHSLWQGKGVEFRLFQFNRYDPAAPAGHRQGGLHAGRLKAYVQLCMAIVGYANKARSCKPTKLQNGNDKYAMRCWLLRLGFIGPEFETARSVFTEKLQGDSSWVGGRPQQAV